jgi:hypothetical protein
MTNPKPKRTCDASAPSREKQDAGKLVSLAPLSFGDGVQGLAQTRPQKAIATNARLKSRND